MDFRTALRIKYGKVPGDMEEVDNYFGSMVKGQFKAMGSASSKASNSRKSKPRKPGAMPRKLN